MATAATDKLLGVGLYTPQEAARLARIPTSTVRRWMYGNEVGDRVINPQLPEDEGQYVTFHDFVQLLAVRAIRRDRKVPLQKIRDTVDIAENEYGIHFPFARRHTTFLFGNDIQLEVGEGKLIQASGKEKHQRAILQVAELYMEDLSFDADGLADAYTIFKRGSRKVVMDPDRNFGAPLVSSCNYPASVLVHAYQTEGGIQAAAEVFGVDPEEVEVALLFEDFIVGAKAA
jgi:uncharacterized protein (DUF433 family)